MYPCIQVGSIDHSERKSVQVSGSIEEVKPNNDVEVTDAEDNRSSDPGETLHTVEGGKKDPSVRREELLVKSGLAEVCCFGIMSSLLFLISNLKIKAMLLKTEIVNYG